MSLRSGLTTHIEKREISYQCAVDEIKRYV